MTLDEQDREVFRGRLAVLVAGAGTPPERYAELEEEARVRFGEEDPLVLEISHRTIKAGTMDYAASLAALQELEGRAASALAPGHEVLRRIRYDYIRQIRYRAAFGALDEVVRRRKDFASKCLQHGAEGRWWGIATSDLAVAYIDRARYGHLDPLIVTADPAADLIQAMELCTAEIARREQKDGKNHPYTWHARRVHADATIAYARLVDHRHAAEAERLATELVAYRSARRGGGRKDEWRMLRDQAKLMLAEALNLTGQPRRALEEARNILIFKPTRELDPGMRLIIEAEALSKIKPASARYNAERALERRLDYYGANSYKVAQAKHLITQIDSGGDVRSAR